ncbi:MAG: hypothetical protein V1726_07515 [Methanobacteriota archaeon]
MDVKNKYLMIGIIAVVVIILIVWFNIPSEKAKDTDGDGYPDVIDDFPTDPKYHEKNGTLIDGIISPFNLTIERGSNGLSVRDFIDSDWKFFTVSWLVVNPRNLTSDEIENISMVIRNRHNQSVPFSEVTIPYTVIGDLGIVRYITEENSGEWTWSFINNGVQREFIITVEIFKIK